jgi:hypothetical protein
VVIVGLILLGVTAGCDLLQDRFGRRSRCLALLVPLAFLAATVNPYGFTYWSALFRVFGETFARVQEYAPLWQLSQPEEVLVPATLLLGLAVLAWASNPARRWSHLAWLGLTAGLLVWAVRMTWIMTIVCLLVTAANARALDPIVLWHALGRRLSRRMSGAAPPPAYLRWLVRGAVLAWLTMTLFVRYSALQCTPTFLPESLAAGPVRFVREHRPDGRVFNDYENASYLHWCFAGEPKLFIDLLPLTYPDTVTRDYVHILSLSPRGLAVLEEQIDWVILTTNRPGPSLTPLADYLDRSHHWLRVFADSGGAIWVRRRPETERRWRALARSAKTISFGSLETLNREVLPGDLR